MHLKQGAQVSQRQTLSKQTHLSAMKDVTADL